MSKTRGNVLDPDAMAELFGVDGVRYMVLREVPFDRDADVSFDSFVRRYNADLANDFGNLLNRTLNMTTRFLDGERPAAARGLGAGTAWAEAWATYSDAAWIDYLLHDALAALWDFVGEANRFVDREQPWALAKQAREGDADAAQRLRGALGDLLEALRLVALTVAPFMPDTGRRVFDQLGLDWPYSANGSGGPPLADAATWGASRTEGRLGTQQILFPRVELPADEDAPSA